jgi:hypothetical protein
VSAAVRRGLARKACAILACAILLNCFVSMANAQDSSRLVLDDVERFATLMDAPELPSAAVLQSGYLDPGTAGVRIFTPHRIRDATTLAKAIARDPEAYRRALRLCLPVARQLQGEAAEIAIRVGALLGSTRAATTYVVMGAGNSGGTASAEGLVLGLEVICRQAADSVAAHRWLRDFIAHELVHVHQQRAGAEHSSSDLLRQSLREGFADHVMELVTGGNAVADQARHHYGLAHEAQLWREFSTAIEQGSGLRGWLYSPAAQAGRPPDMGYWIGKRICQAYMAHPSRASNPGPALQTLLLLRDPRSILLDSGYGRGLLP